MLSSQIVPLKLCADHIQTVRSHAERSYPHECCGLLLGVIQPQEKILVEVRAVQNAWDEQVATDLGDQPSLTKTRRYWIAPEEMLAAMRDARSRKLDVIGVYHSHPDQPAVPSECDRQLAWQQYSYIIVSVQQGKAADLQSWLLNENHQFQREETLIITPYSLTPAPYPLSPIHIVNRIT
ncbi:MAG: M67 family metallopeptidase [Leptolyngbyaceae cyanobacterium RU_5_1]|nr:M67 family metallopeptidase [Leptolyngbyaceae cyanobacterium RU_5_1]